MGYLIDKIGWWFLRHSKPPKKLYYCLCPKCKTVEWHNKKYIVKNNGLHTCGTKMEIYDLKRYG